MIHNSWNMFHETEKLLGSSPGNVALTLTNRNISEFTLNETQEFPSQINSADESQDCVRLVYFMKKHRPFSNTIFDLLTSNFSKHYLSGIIGS